LLLITWPFGANIIKPLPIANESDLIAIATKKGRLLIFPVTELPTNSNEMAHKY